MILGCIAYYIPSFLPYLTLPTLPSQVKEKMRIVKLTESSIYYTTGVHTLPLNMDARNATHHTGCSLCFSPVSFFPYLSRSQKKEYTPRTHTDLASKTRLCPCLPHDKKIRTPKTLTPAKTKIDTKTATTAAPPNSL